MRLRRRNPTVDATVSVDAQTLVDSIVSSFSPDEVIAFIVALDAAAQNWSVTEPLCRHFAELQKQYEKETQPQSEPQR